jgi:hypothetical protein
LLWGKSAGRCAYPSCPNKCIDSFEMSGPILVGEMAHVLAIGKGGPRSVGQKTRSLDRYDNLVLLCPSHHTIVDKAPLDFPSELLRKWKAELEQRISNALDVPTFKTKAQLYEYAETLLNENKFIHDNFGPSSKIAAKNPLSNLHAIWIARKIEQIIPNNSLIVAAFARYLGMMPANEIEVYRRFEAHSVAFAASSQRRRDSVPMFPPEFAAMLTRREVSDVKKV